jgi:Tol biopolymer transport system component
MRSSRRVSVVSRTTWVTALIGVVTAVWVAPAAWATDPGRANGLIAFVRGGNIWTAHPDGTRQLQLTRGGAGGGLYPRWSPNGTRLAFVRGSDIWTMNADGSHPAPVTAGTEPTWSPDGHYLAYERGNRCGNSAIFMIKSTAPYGKPVELTFVDNTCVIQVSHTNPTWSSKGGTIAFSDNDNPGGGPEADVGVINVASKKVTWLGLGSAQYSQLDSSNYGPAGNNLLYRYFPGVNDPHPIDGIYQYGPSGVTLIVPAGAGAGAGGVTDPTWSPHLGLEILYTDHSGPTPRVMEARSSGAGAHSIITNAIMPDWQPVP